MADAINKWVSEGESFGDILAGIDLMMDTIAGFDVDIGAALYYPNRIQESAGTAPGNPFLYGAEGFAGEDAMNEMWNPPTTAEDALYALYGMTPPSQGSQKGGVTNNYNVTLPNVTDAQSFSDEMEAITKMKNLQETGNRHGAYEV